MNDIDFREKPGVCNLLLQVWRAAGAFGGGSADEGEVCHSAMQAALDGLVQMHEALRTRMLWQDASKLRQSLVEPQDGLLMLQVSFSHSLLPSYFII